MCLSPSKTLRTGPYKSLVHRWFYEHENCIGGPILLEREYEAELVFVNVYGAQKSILMDRFRHPM
jgi:hypothetical protein